MENDDQKQLAKKLLEKALPSESLFVAVNEKFNPPKITEKGKIQNQQ